MNGHFRPKNGTIPVDCDLSHRFRLINLLDCEKFGGQSAEDLLGCRDHAARLVNTAGNIQQTEDDPARTDAKEIMKAAALPLAVIQSRKLGSVAHGNRRLQQLSRYRKGSALPL